MTSARKISCNVSDSFKLIIFQNTSIIMKIALSIGTMSNYDVKGNLKILLNK